jgi:hypothetical protein
MLLLVPDAYSHPLFNPEIDRATQFTTRNILCTAIKDMSGKNIAVVQVRKWCVIWSGAAQGVAEQVGAGSCEPSACHLYSAHTES